MSGEFAVTLFFSSHLNTRKDFPFRKSRQYFFYPAPIWLRLHTCLTVYSSFFLGALGRFVGQLWFWWFWFWFWATQNSSCSSPPSGFWGGWGSLPRTLFASNGFMKHERPKKLKKLSVEPLVCPGRFLAAYLGGKKAVTKLVISRYADGRRLIYHMWPCNKCGQLSSEKPRHSRRFSTIFCWLPFMLYFLTTYILTTFGCMILFLTILQNYTIPAIAKKSSCQHTYYSSELIVLFLLCKSIAVGIN